MPQKTWGAGLDGRALSRGHPGAQRWPWSWYAVIVTHARASPCLEKPSQMRPWHSTQKNEAVFSCPGYWRFATFPSENPCSDQKAIHVPGTDKHTISTSYTQTHMRAPFAAQHVCPHSHSPPLCKGAHSVDHTPQQPIPGWETHSNAQL